MNNKLIYLLISICALPHVAETIYAPALPDIQKSLLTTAQLTQWTLSTFLLGYAIGVRIWGHFSDHIGRQQALLYAYIGFLAACVMGFCSTSITVLLIARALQGFFGSVGSSVPQAMFVNHLSHKKRFVILARTGQILAIGPAIGPAIGIHLTETFNWHSIFVFLAIAALCLIILLKNTTFPPRTTPNPESKIQNFYSQTLIYIITISTAITTGLFFFNQSGFYFQKALGMSDWFYQNIFIGIALSWFIGGKISEYLIKNDILSPRATIQTGGYIAFTFALILYGLTQTWIPSLSPSMQAIMTLSLTMALMIGTSFQIGNCIGSALSLFQENSGQAASKLAFSYYLLAAFITFLAVKVQTQDTLMLARTLLILCTTLAICSLIMPKTKGD